MLDAHQVFIIGDSLFAETLTLLLAGSPSVSVVGVAPSVEEALPLLQSLRPDAVIVAGVDTVNQARLGPLPALVPELPIIRADLNNDYVQLITSRRIEARCADLLAAIQALPKEM